MQNLGNYSDGIGVNLYQLNCIDEDIFDRCIGVIWVILCVLGEFSYFGLWI